MFEKLIISDATNLKEDIERKIHRLEQARPLPTEQATLSWRITELKWVLDIIEKNHQSELTPDEIYNNKLETITLYEAIDWWLKHYEGLEHLANSSEQWYAINTILKRCFEKIKSKMKKPSQK